MNLSKNKIKWITALQIKKFRQKYHKFLVEGDKIVRELLQHREWATEELYALPEWLEKHASLLDRQEMVVQPVSEQELSRISALHTPQQVLAVAAMQDLPQEQETIRRDLSLYLDGIQDPGNLGAILRIADWFGVRHVFLSPETVEVFNPKVIQASMGAFLRVRTPVTDLQTLLGTTPALTVWGADLSGTDVFQTGKLPAGLVLVIGNEGGGITPSCQALLRERITIPRQEGGQAESLNAAVAAGIIVAALRNAR